jgi:hypothetical protein
MAISTRSPSSTTRRIRAITSRPRTIAGHAPLDTPPVVTPRIRRRVLALVAVLIVAAILIYDMAGLNDLRTDPITGVDYVPIAGYVAARHKPGEAILAALPAPAFLAVDSTDDLIFLSSPLNRKRAQRYTRLTVDGRYLDYWTGSDSVVDVAGLCNTLLTAPKVWVVIDASRLEADWAYLGPMADVITGLTYVQYYDESGSQVRRLAPLPARDPFAESICSAAQTGQPLPTRPLVTPVP